MLTGVCTESSAKTKEGWLSEDACLEGASSLEGGSKLGVPARLSGLEKLNEGRGRTAESKEPTDEDL